MKKLFFLSVLFLLSNPAVHSTALQFSGDASLVSTYFFRGVKQFNGAAMQGTGQVSYGALAVGYWISGMGGPMSVETDPYIGLSLPTGAINTSVGATLYSYDFFAKKEYTVYEVFASAGYGPLSVSFFYTPVQDGPGVTDALYWLDVAAGVHLSGVDVGATLSLGNYSAASSADAAANILLTAARAVTETLSVSWNWNIALSDGPENGFYMGASYAF